MQRNKKIYEGQNIFVGIDVHARQWHVYASPWPGLGMRAICMPPDAHGLLSYLEKTFPGGSYKSAYESGFCGFSSHRQLKSIGIDNIVFNAADLRKSQKEILRKTDAVDCKAIWENLAKEELTSIYTPTEIEEQDRELIRGRECVVKDLRRNKQRIKMFLHKLGIDVPAEYKNNGVYWSVKFIDWLQALADSLPGGYSHRLGALVEQIHTLKDQKKAYEKEILTVMKDRHEEMGGLLRSIPGIGHLLSAKICMELMNFNRFADARNLAGYIGLVPDCKNSDQKTAVLGTSIRRNSILRTALIEASWIAITKDPTLGRFFHSHRQQGKHANLAIIAVARKLVNRIFYVWRTKQKYEVSKE